MVTVKMKTRKPKDWYSNRNAVPPPILFKRSVWTKDTDSAMVSTFKLRCNPTESDSQVYELKARSFDTGTVEQFILWKRDLDKVIQGQNVTRPVDKFAMARRVLEGDALATFNESTMGIETQVTFIESMKALASHIFPNFALSNQRAWLRRSDDVRKKPNMSTRRWAARLNEINQMLLEFPPKFNETQKLSEDDFIEVIEYGIPQSWRAKMVEQGFIPIQHTLAEIIEFCEKMEYAEEMVGTPNKTKNNSYQGKSGQNAEADPSGGDHYTGSLQNAKPSPGSSRKRRERHTSYAESNGGDGCCLHENATDHTTGECRVLLAQAKRMRAVWDAQPREQNSAKRQKTNNNNYSKGNGNKGTYQKKNNGDFHTLLNQTKRIQDSLERAIRQQETSSGKRKTRDFEDERKDEDFSDHQDSDNFVFELDQLSLSDNEHMTSQDLSDDQSHE